MVLRGAGSQLQQCFKPTGISLLMKEGRKEGRGSIIGRGLKLVRHGVLTHVLEEGI